MADTVRSEQFDHEPNIHIEQLIDGYPSRIDSVQLLTQFSGQSELPQSVANLYQG